MEQPSNTDLSPSQIKIEEQPTTTTEPAITTAETTLIDYSDYNPTIISDDIDNTRLLLPIFRDFKRLFPTETDETLIRFLIGIVHYTFLYISTYYLYKHTYNLCLLLL